jgi:hypothetical protein
MQDVLETRHHFCHLEFESQPSRQLLFAHPSGAVDENLEGDLWQPHAKLNDV